MFTTSSAMASESSTKLVGKVKNVYIYPAKGFKGISVDRAECMKSGIRVGNFYDRQWVIVQAKDRQVVLAGHVPKILTIQTEIQDEQLVLSAPGMEPVRLHVQPTYTEKDLIYLDFAGDGLNTIDCGDEVADWLDRYLEKPSNTYRLLFHPVSEKPRLCQAFAPDSWKNLTTNEDVVLISNSFPLHMLTVNSVSDLNARLRDKYKEDPPVIESTQFRANIEVEADKPYAEDTWSKIYIGDREEGPIMTRMKLKDRCATSAVNLRTGERIKNGEPLPILREYRPILAAYMQGKFKLGPGPAFGTACTLERYGPIRVGDPVYAIEDPL